jgi:protocatechuate 3,4-dioxygenase alpha subunit
MTSASSVVDAVLIPTSSQTVGPFVEIGCTYLATDRVAGPMPGMFDVTVRGRVLDGDGEPVPDYMLEIWQTTGKALDGQRSFRRFATQDDDQGRFATQDDDQGRFATQDDDQGRFATQDDHPGVITSGVAFGRVMPLGRRLIRLPHGIRSGARRQLRAASRDARFHARTPQAAIYPDVFPGRRAQRRRFRSGARPPDRRATLVARRDSLSDGSLEWNIVLQGANETVFFEW